MSGRWASCFYSAVLCLCGLVLGVRVRVSRYVGEVSCTLRRRMKGMSVLMGGWVGGLPMVALRAMLPVELTACSVASWVAFCLPMPHAQSTQPLL